MATKKSAQSILMWILMALLIAGLGGFGIDGFLSQRVTSIGSVGGRDIDAQTYSRALQSEMRAFEQQVGQSVNFSQARAFGLDVRVRQQLVTQAALENEAERIGISVGDANVQRTLTSIGAFQGPGGAFDRETYRFQLQNIGQTPAVFEEEIRRDAARGILQAATAAGIETPGNLRAALIDFYATRHSFDLFTITEDHLPTAVAEPDSAAIQAYYDANIAEFTAPEIRSITYAWLTPEMLNETVDVDEASIRALYESRLEEFVQPERRLIERLVYPDAAAAQAAVDRVTAGSATFEDLVAERGLTLEDADMGDVSESQLGDAGPALFALEDAGTVVGPLPTNLGPAVFRMNAILNAQETPFSEVRDTLRAELAGDSARRAIAEQQESFDDLLAGGATLEDLANETSMMLGHIDWNPEISEGIAAYTEFAAAAAAVTADDFPELAGLSDGGLFALRLDAIIPPTPYPLDEVRAEVSAAARQVAVNSALMALAQDWSAELASSGIETFSEAHDLSPDTFEGITRLDRLSQIPAPMLELILTSDAGTPVVHVDQGQAMLALVTGAEPADLEDEQTQRLVNAIDEQVGSALAQDVFEYFARALEAEAGITLNQAAIEAVHTSFP
ncbi:peptidylprolyl isomerase [Pararhodobacter sp.]|uniref:peptidylprolyl isomerase n=1 Tax=Pararhodobacter sp. TaxID=2127056 RepID=UPI002AFDFCC6|nr:SurA N-terminal domain-containing protein [Pararhodobacter sp.]